MIEQASLNRVWATLILEELTRFGVEDICIAPGSRSTPLTLEADANLSLNLHCHFDERGLAFYALGLAKASHNPVAIVVTSGTAVANLLPAICEANLTGEKLVVLTADRPVELIDCGANQAIDQMGIFSSHVSKAVNLPSPNTRIPANWLLSTVDEAMHFQSEHGGVVHFNCPYPEPLYDGNEANFDDPYLLKVKPWYESRSLLTGVSHFHSQPSLSTDSFSQVHSIESKKGVVILGSLNLSESQKALELAKCLGWPVFCDPQSGVSSEFAHYDLWLRSPEASKALDDCNLILQFGARLVSKRLLNWIEKRGDHCDYQIVQPYQQRLNPSHRVQHRVIADVGFWCENALTEISPSDIQYHGWGDALKKVSEITQKIIRSHEFVACSEADLVMRLFDYTLDVPTVFLGNSLLVRLVDMLAKTPELEIYSNRGASGIDGLVATAAGVHSASKNKSLVMIGDTSLLHDLNSLSLWTHTNTHPSVILVSNNDGGAIFDLLPVPKERKRALYQMPHGYQFKHAAMQFGLGYAAPSDTSSCIQEIVSHLASGNGTLLVELITPSEQTSCELKPITEKVCNDLGSQYVFR
ncbi:2-succinyl-5-enolpyruvyl-6-hydroxy-3-cyclohexene-1-carboxylic-acid synthase [Vibrio penaeicida]|uniref:2-succinyl-5-enolpyruvyl-6-hydroxy-3-cyclohexene-1-carboxylate synthase n=1 Tax=Vibrio penaeicida TaxID=104609 RepID=A0AAV5NN68_9VIBR|nr:2-succinyl-5-enolpyruvyl-6-hydroxy-3-cyclohexene-1-carboxylic-acid synthase [Vibrio penaeicida]GLQ71809.1 2-succinyl-5-enolpyruvyl-6-hydroxy-3-cyclohexene- 1-carboxylate synthase [Vibrio penaeicida]